MHSVSLMEILIINNDAGILFKNNFVFSAAFVDLDKPVLLCDFICHAVHEIIVSSKRNDYRHG